MKKVGEKGRDRKMKKVGVKERNREKKKVEEKGRDRCKRPRQVMQSLQRTLFGSPLSENKEE